MLILTVFRLRNVSNPTASLLRSTLPWKIAVCLVWLIAIFLGILPIIKFDSFVSAALFKNTLFSNKAFLWTKQYLIQFACRFAIMTNQSLDSLNDPWQSVKTFIKANFQDDVIGFGYFSESGFCTADIFFDQTYTAWEYRVILILINFFSFIFIAVSYVIMYYLPKKKSKKSKKSTKPEATMRKHIARIIATDFFCWIPISIIIFVILSNDPVRIPSFILQICYFLVPINSALNPFLYSSLPDILIKKLCRCCGEKHLKVAVSVDQTVTELH